MRNHPEFVETMIAASISATVFVPIDPRTKGEKLAYTLRNAGCKGILLADYNLAQLEEIRGSLPDLSFSLAMETGEDEAPPIGDFQGVESLDEVLDRPAETVDIRLESEADPLQIIYTSGTTGDPKGVVMQNGRYGGMSMLGRMIFQFAPDEKLYTGLSLTHGNAQAVTLSAALCIELPAVICRRCPKSRLWDLCR